MRLREQYLVELAQTVHDMFSRGELDPSATEIAEAHFAGRALVGEIIESVRKRLPRVRDLLETEFEHPVYLLSSTYYVLYRQAPPTTSSDARRCLPLGYGKHVEGIKLHEDADDDLIYQAMLEQNFSAAGGKFKKGANRTIDAVEAGQLSEPAAAELLDDARRRALPSKPEVVDRVLKSLPAEEL